MTIVAVINLKGGVGKTTTAVNLAWLSARDRTPTLLWDLDPQGAASFTLRVRPQVNVGCGRLLRDEDALAEAIKGTDFPGLDLLPADFSYRKLDRTLARSDGKGRALARTLAPLRAAYARIVLDCPPGISVLAENVFAAADALLVPSLPQVLSLRALAQLSRLVAGRPGNCPRVLPFLNMVDRRKALHRAVADGVRAGNSAWLETAIPHASLLEQMGTERAPVGVFAPGSAVAADLERLWAEVLAALGQRGERDDDARRQQCVRLADDIDALIRELDRHDPEEHIHRAATAVAAPPPEPLAPRSEERLALELAGEADVTALLRAALLTEAADVRVERLRHVYDTPDRALSSAGASLHLIEEGGRFSVIAALADGSEGGVSVDAHWAFEILSGRRSPFDVLRARAQRPLLPLVERLHAAIAGRAAARTSSLRCVCRHFAAVCLTDGAAASPAFALELQRHELADGRVAHRAVIEAAPRDTAACELFLRGLFERAGLDWRPAAEVAVARPPETALEPARGDAIPPAREDAPSAVPRGAARTRARQPLRQPTLGEAEGSA